MSARDRLVRRQRLRWRRDRARRRAIASATAPHGAELAERRSRRRGPSASLEREIACGIERARRAPRSAPQMAAALATDSCWPQIDPRQAGEARLGPADLERPGPLGDRGEPRVAAQQAVEVPRERLGANRAGLSNRLGSC